MTRGWRISATPFFKWLSVAAFGAMSVGVVLALISLVPASPHPRRRCDSAAFVRRDESMAEAGLVVALSGHQGHLTSV